MISKRLLYVTLITLFLISLICYLIGPAHADSAVKVGEVVTTWNNWYKLGAKSDTISIERFDDPKVKNVSCYVSRANKGGYLANVGMAEDPSQFSIACRATSKPVLGDVNKSEEGESVFSTSASAFFKTVRVQRFFDREKNVLVYVVFSTKLIDGSPANSVTAVPLD